MSWELEIDFMNLLQSRPSGLVAIDREMAKQHKDSLDTFDAVREVASRAASAIRSNGELILLGMGGSHAVNRIVQPLYRGLGFDTVALPLSEQLAQPLRIEGKTILLTSQSGESAEVVRWIEEAGSGAQVFGLTLEQHSFLGTRTIALVGSGGTELAFAATRSLMVTLALHLSILAALGLDAAASISALSSPEKADVDGALTALKSVGTIVTSGRRLQGLAELAALGFTELSRLPCFSLEGGQLRHGPMEMLGPDIGVVLFREADDTAPLVKGMAIAAAETGAPVIVFDASSDVDIQGVATVRFKPATGLAAVFAMLPVLHSLIIAVAEARVDDAGTPLRTTKVTRVE
jgi:fructoselysine-6-P-deglycase FrlB-like protein